MASKKEPWLKTGSKASRPSKQRLLAMVRELQEDSERLYTCGDIAAIMRWVCGDMPEEEVRAALRLHGAHPATRTCRISGPL